MSLPFRIRRAEWVAGAFVLLAVVGLVGSLVLLSRARGGFEATVTYHVVLADGHGITPGGPVEMLGISIGRIEALEITDDNKVAARLEVRETFAPRIREDSIARVKASLDLQGVLGGVGLSVSPGSANAAVLPEDSIIEVSEPRSVTDLLPLVEGDPLLADIEVLVHNARLMSEQVADPNSPLQQALTEATALLAKVQDRRSTIGRVLQDDGELYQRLLGTLDEVDGSLKHLEKVLERSDRLLGRAGGMMNDAGQLMSDADKLMEGGEGIIKDFDAVLDGTDTAMKDLDEAVLSFGQTTKKLEKVVEALVPLVEDMDQMVKDMDDVANAAKRMWILRRQARKIEREQK